MPKAVPTNKHEAKLRKAGHHLIAGVDEAGKGSWAGPLVTAAVILDETDIPKELFDSKMLTPQQRERAFVAIAKKALAWSVHVVQVSEIDKHGVHKANLAALQRAVEKLHISPDAVLVDAFKIAVANTPVINIIDGDALERTIGAASIMAKVTRDRLMSSEVNRAYPHFHFQVHKGYGTSLHAKLLAMHGPTPEHRMSFEPVKNASKEKSAKPRNKRTAKKVSAKRGRNPAPKARSSGATGARVAKKTTLFRTKPLKRSIKKKPARAKKRTARKRR
ncbi:MAG: ribonuclease HII [Patescibacteria group bacterium]